MLWVYGCYKYFHFYSAGIQILTTKADPRAVKPKATDTDFRRIIGHLDQSRRYLDQSPHEFYV